mmetsp:Transcript_59419/g.165951  ORF Transcript_59419/g.165951 Transcript_59419/m.165951 type:complete len:267 (+) Transcript_59419:48-848(+)
MAKFPSTRGSGHRGWKRKGGRCNTPNRFHVKFNALEVGKSGYIPMRRGNVRFAKLTTCTILECNVQFCACLHCQANSSPSPGQLVMVNEPLAVPVVVVPPSGGALSVLTVRPAGAELNAPRPTHRPAFNHFRIARGELPTLSVTVLIDRQRAPEPLFVLDCVAHRHRRKKTVSVIGASEIGVATIILLPMLHDLVEDLVGMRGQTMEANGAALSASEAGRLLYSSVQLPKLAVRAASNRAFGPIAIRRSLPEAHHAEPTHGRECVE